MMKRYRGIAFLGNYVPRVCRIATFTHDLATAVANQLVPNENEREGYVPNVVYSCGSMIHNGKLVLPYAMADYASRVALVDLKELLAYLH